MIGGLFQFTTGDLRSLIFENSPHLQILQTPNEEKVPLEANENGVTAGVSNVAQVSARSDGSTVYSPKVNEDYHEDLQYYKDVDDVDAGSLENPKDEMDDDLNQSYVLNDSEELPEESKDDENVEILEALHPDQEELDRLFIAEDSHLDARIASNLEATIKSPIHYSKQEEHSPYSLPTKKSLHSGPYQNFKDYIEKKEEQQIKVISKAIKEGEEEEEPVEIQRISRNAPPSDPSKFLRGEIDKKDFTKKEAALLITKKPITELKNAPVEIDRKVIAPINKVKGAIKSGVRTIARKLKKKIDKKLDDRTVLGREVDSILGIE